MSYGYLFVEGLGHKFVVAVDQLLYGTVDGVGDVRLTK